jgi:hypothetical protein
MKTYYVSSFGVFTDETFCNVKRVIEPSSNKLMMSESSMRSSNMNQLILVGGIPSNSCEDTSSTKQRARATRVRNWFCNVDDGSEMR